MPYPHSRSDVSCDGSPGCLSTSALRFSDRHDRRHRPGTKRSNRRDAHKMRDTPLMTDNPAATLPPSLETQEDSPYY